MFAALKLIVAMGIAFATLIASIVETPYPRLATGFWIAFGIGVVAAEWMRARRRRSVRYLARKALKRQGPASGLIRERAIG